MSVLVVCTANVCRSPLAARLLSASLGVPVMSAGARAVPGMSPCQRTLTIAPPPTFRADHAIQSDHAIRTAAGGGVRVEASRGAVRLEAAHVRTATLVLGAAREHRSAAIGLVPNAQRRSFTLLQAARL